MLFLMARTATADQAPLVHIRAVLKLNLAYILQKSGAKGVEYTAIVILALP